MTSPSSSSSETAHLAALRALGLLASNEAVSLQPLTGNPERLETATSAHYFVIGPQGPQHMLSVGPDLASMVARSRLFAAAYPALACSIRGDGRHQGLHYVLQEYFPGRRATEIITGQTDGAQRVQAALQVVDAAFRAAEQPSTVAAAQAELDEFAAQIIALPYWTALDRAFIESTVLPYLREGLISLAPTRRVTNGDLILRNLLIDDANRVRIIDYEHALESHFHGEDWLRVSFWDIVPEGIRQFSASRIGQSGPMRAYLALKQILLESQIHRPQRAASQVHHWAKFLEQILGEESNLVRLSMLWPASDGALALGAGELQAQFFWMTDEGWSNERSCLISVQSGRHQTVQFTIPAGADVHALRFDPLNCPGVGVIFNVTVRQLDPEPKVLFTAFTPPEFALATVTGDALFVPDSKEPLEFVSVGPDPQVHFNQMGGPGSSRLSVEITFSISTSLVDQVRHLRRVRQPASATPAPAVAPAEEIRNLTERVHAWFTGEEGLRARLMAEFSQQRQQEQSAQSSAAKLTVANALLNERTEDLRQLRDQLTGYARTIDRLELALAALNEELPRQMRQREEAFAHFRNAEDQSGRLSQQLAAVSERARLLEIELTAARQNPRA